MRAFTKIAATTALTGGLTVCGAGAALAATSDMPGNQMLESIEAITAEAVDLWFEERAHDPEDDADPVPADVPEDGAEGSKDSEGSEGSEDVQIPADSAEPAEGAGSAEPTEDVTGEAGSPMEKTPAEEAPVEEAPTEEEPEADSRAGEAPKGTVEPAEDGVDTISLP